MEQIKHCKYCQKNIGPLRQWNAHYCSDNCYKKAKSERDAAAYKLLSSKIKKWKNNIEILARFYSLCQSGESIPVRYFINENFDWDCYDETVVYKKQQYKRVGDYGYTVAIAEDTQTVNICKFR